MPSARAAATAGARLLVVLGPEQAVLAAVRVDARHGDPRRRDPHAPQVPMAGADRLEHPLRRRPVDRGAQRDMGRDVDDVQPLGGEQHPRRLLPGQVREQAGVAVVVVAGGVQRLLVDRRGDDAGGLARLRPVRRRCGCTGSGLAAARTQHAEPVRQPLDGHVDHGDAVAARRDERQVEPAGGERPTEHRAVADDGEVAPRGASRAASALTVTSGPTPGRVAHGDHDRAVVRSGHSLVLPLEAIRVVNSPNSTRRYAIYPFITCT